MANTHWLKPMIFLRNKLIHKRLDTISGFTLIEILVALSVIAIALGALVKAGSNHTQSVAYLKQKTLAHYVAMNEIALLQAKQKWPDLGKKHKSSEMAEQEWFWTQEVLKVIDPFTEKTSTLTRQVRVTVYTDDEREHSLITLFAYLTSQNISSRSSSTNQATPP